MEVKVKNEMTKSVDEEIQYITQKTDTRPSLVPSIRMF